MGDLRLDLGLMPALDGDEPSYTKCVDQVCQAAKKHGDLPLLTFTRSPDAIKKRFAEGFNMFVCGADVFSLGAAARTELKESVEAVKESMAGASGSGKRTA